MRESSASPPSSSYSCIKMSEPSVVAATVVAQQPQPNSNSGGNSNNTQSIADYLAQLLKDKKSLSSFPNVFLHMERLLDDEIGKVRGNLFQINGKKNEPLVLPDATGAPINLSEKVYVPIKEYPDFNFVGRILGPRGMTTKQLEQETGCKIMVRGKGSMRDKKKEDQNRGKPNWEHLNDDLHVLITVEDTENRAAMKLQRAVDEVKKLLTVSEGEDELKKRQLMELAIINGTYRDSQSKIAGSRKLNKASSFSFPSKDENTARVEITNCINKLLEFVLSSQ
jgi:protein quaking